MATGIIKQAKMSKSGKTLRILVGDEWYSTNNFALQQAVGREIQFDVGTSEWQGNVIYWANEAELVSEGSAPATSNQAAPAQAQSQSPTGTDRMQFMPFVSNTVAHAIGSGAIKSPEEIYAWASKAFHTAKSLVEGKEHTEMAPAEDFDDSIPF